ncbi:MAG TPA: EamA family transporter [Steroidobacteraceae bacterium]|jgi:drug/metabolite transporter (DMT)-like permease
MQLAWLLLAIVTTVGYHLVMKLTPAAVNPLLSLAASYTLGAAVFLACYALAPDGPPLREALKPLNWTVFALAAMVVGLDVGFLMLYRSGFDVSLGQIVTQSGAALVLVIAGVALFREKVNAANLAGIALCVIGLWLINRK